MEADEKFIDMVEKVEAKVQQLDDLFKDDYTSVVFASLVTFACKRKIKYLLFDRTKEDVERIMKEILKDDH